MTINEVMAAFELLYPDKLGFEAVERNAPAAMALVSAMTARRSDLADGWQKQRALQAVCAVIREMATQDAARTEDGARLSSVNNDGYSESYAVSNAGADEKALRDAAHIWLSGTGMVSAL